MFSFFGIVFPFIFSLVFIGIIAIFVIIMVKGVKESRYNNAQPRLTVDAKVIGKRTKVTGDHARTYYYATFEVESGDRLELKMNGNEFGMLIEGDAGKLTFQGNKYLEFERR